jgi:hypothetical protein
MTDDLHDEAAKYARVDKSTADWRSQMLQSLPEDIPMYTAERFKYYKEAGIPETVYKDLYSQVLHLAMQARFPGQNLW